MAYHIDGPQMGALSRAIADAFPNPMKLQQTLAFKLDDNIFNHTGVTGDYPQIRFNLVQEYNARWHIDRLVVALLEQVPDNGLLLEFAWRHQLVGRPPGSSGAVAPGDDSLERMLDPERGFTDPVGFLRRFGQHLNRVCRIAVPLDGGTEYGTGFLIGNQTVLTNYHVVRHVINKFQGADRKQVTLLFDYRTAPDGETVSDGVPFRLWDHDTDWLVDFSPYDQADLTPRSIAETLQGERQPDNLDYAVLRVAGNPGKTSMGNRPTDDGAVRGFIELPAADRDFSRDFDKDHAAVFILQHPNKEPLRLDWEKPAILGVNRNETRVLYNVNTKHGSSGSPCFNAKLELIALHHAGGKDWPAPGTYLYNQGIPIGKIQKLLDDRGKMDIIRTP